jgi:hypothetical protein
MVVGNLDIESVAFIPAEAEAVLVVDPNAILPFAVSGERFQSVARKQRQVAKRGRTMQVEELPQRDFSDRLQLSRELLPEYVFRFGVSKRADR